MKNVLTFWDEISIPPLNAPAPERSRRPTFAGHRGWEVWGGVTQGGRAPRSTRVIHLSPVRGFQSPPKSRAFCLFCPKLRVSVPLRQNQRLLAQTFSTLFKTL